MRVMSIGKQGRGSTGRSLLAWLVVVLTFVMPATNSFAASKVCRQLEAQLVALSNGGGKTSGQSRKYDGAIARQRQQLSIARGRASDLGCGYAVFGRNVRQCAGLNGTISRMQNNLSKLERTRGSLAGGSGGKSRGRILASLDANGCRGESEVVKRRPRDDVGGDRKRTGLLAGLFGLRSGVDASSEPRQDRREIARMEPDTRLREEKTTVRRRERAGNKPAEAAGARKQDRGFSTMCVRTCDGYFFPMSPSSSAAEFDRDQKNCESACPGAQMQVFFKDKGAAEDSDMMSVATGRPYAELATAYRYKDGPDARPATCGCNVARNFSVIAGNPPAPQSPPAASAVEAPTTLNVEATAAEPSQTATQVAATSPASSPAAATTGTVVKEPGSPSIITIIPAAAPPTAAQVPTVAAAAEPEALTSNEPVSQTEPLERDLDADGRKVRVVGPTFLPDPAGAIDLRAPAPTKVQ